MNLRLSRQADQDLEGIFSYGIEKFGLQKAELYITTLTKTCFFLCDHPKAGRYRCDLHPPCYAIQSEKHIVFYDIIDNTVLIQRILHSAQDWENMSLQ